MHVSSFLIHLDSRGLLCSLSVTSAYGLVPGLTHQSLMSCCQSVKPRKVRITRDYCQVTERCCWHWAWVTAFSGIACIGGFIEACNVTEEWELLTAYQRFLVPNHCSVLNISIMYKVNSEISHNVFLVFCVTKTKSVMAVSKKHV